MTVAGNTDGQKHCSLYPHFLLFMPGRAGFPKRWVMSSHALGCNLGPPTSPCSGYTPDWSHYGSQITRNVEKPPLGCARPGCQPTLLASVGLRTACKGLKKPLPVFRKPLLVYFLKSEVTFQGFWVPQWLGEWVTSPVWPRGTPLPSR